MINQTKYTTIQGDMWDIISLQVYKTETLMHLLIEANPNYRETVIFPANCQLNIPVQPKQERVQFPPWRNKT